MLSGSGLRWGETGVLASASCRSLGLISYIYRPGRDARQAMKLTHSLRKSRSVMKPGAKWQLFVPPELGYGQSARAGIPGGSLLIYDLELTTVQAAPMPKP